jgi:hypothetical protein
MLFVGDPNGDDNGNGIGNFLEYSLAPPGVEPVLPATGMETFTVSEATENYMTLTYTRNVAADDVEFTPQISANLFDWLDDTDGIFTAVRRIENGDGTETITLRLNNPVSATATLFGRLSVQGRTP